MNSLKIDILNKETNFNKFLEFFYIIKNDFCFLNNNIFIVWISLFVMNNSGQHSIFTFFIKDKKNFEESIAQGTIEYLVIIGVVIVLSLVVVGLVITQVDNSSNVSSVSSEVAFKVGVGGISLASSVVGVDGNGLLVIKNVNSENIVLSKVVVDGVDHNFYEQIVAGDEKSFKLQDVASCESGAKSKSYLVKVEYVSASGLTKIADFEKIRIDCAPVVIPASIVVEEVIIANVVPSIELNYPIDNNSTAETRVSFVFTPSDSDGIITSCSLNLTGSMDANSSFSIVQGEENTLEYTLSIGEYDWNISCMDDDGDTNTSETRTLIVQSYIPGYALSFDGSTNYVNCGGITEFRMQDEFTLSAWVYINEDLSWMQRTIIAKWEDYGIREYKMVTYGAGSNYGVQLIYNYNESVTAGGYILPFGEWHHIVGIKTPTQLQIYINGDLNGSIATSGTVNQGSNPLLIGQQQERDSRVYNGFIDEVLIFNRALSSDEVSQLYNSGDGLYADTSIAPFNNGLVAGYHFDEGSGVTAIDIVGDNNGTLINSPNYINGKVGYYE